MKVVSLPWAAWRGDIDAVQRHLDEGADIDARDRRGWTALMRAADRWDETMVALLLERGADPTIKRRNGRTALFSACQRGSLSNVERLLAAGADPVSTDAHGSLPLELAAGCRRADIVGLVALVPECRACDIRQVLSWERAWGRALARAILRRDEHIVSRLLAAHEDCRSFRLQRRLGDDSLPMVAVRCGSLKILGEILALYSGGYADYDTAGKPVPLAIRLGHFEMLPLLQKHGFELSAKDAVRGGDFNLFLRLLDNDEYALDEVLCAAAYCGEVQMIDELVRRGANASAALHAALHGRKLHSIDRLFALGADPSHRRIGKSLFFNPGVSRDVEVARRLVAHGADPTSPDGLYNAAAFGVVEVVRFLLDRGANPNAVLRDELSPLAGAAFNGRAEIVALLIERGADRHLRSGKDRMLTAAMWAAERGHVHIREMLHGTT